MLTLPSVAIADMSLKGRKAYLASLPGVFNESERRIELVNDNAYVGGDAKAMLYLRLFEDESGRTIAASHAARPFSDHSTPSAEFTKVYAFADGVWREITDSVFSPSIPRDAYFRFDQTGIQVRYGLYHSRPRRDGRGEFYDFGPELGCAIWQDGAFRAEPEANTTRRGDRH